MKNYSCTEGETMASLVKMMDYLTTDMLPLQGKEAT
jgi:hypothetical protein